MAGYEVEEEQWKEMTRGIIKRGRRRGGTAEGDEEEEEAPKPKRRARKSASKPEKSSTSRRRRKAEPEEEEDEGDEFDAGESPPADSRCATSSSETESRVVSVPATASSFPDSRINAFRPVIAAISTAVVASKASATITTPLMFSPSTTGAAAASTDR